LKQIKGRTEYPKSIPESIWIVPNILFDFGCLAISRVFSRIKPQNIWIIPSKSKITIVRYVKMRLACVSWKKHGFQYGPTSPFIYTGCATATSPAAIKRIMLMIMARAIVYAAG
jgi:hypothetical protein